MPILDTALHSAKKIIAHSAEWPEPQTLTAMVVPGPYPLDALPPTILAAVEEVQGFTKAPIPLIASSALGAISLAIQSPADMKRAEGLSGPVGLFLLTIAESGERKSTCDSFFTRAIREHQERKAEEMKPELTAYRADHDSWKAKRAAILDAMRAEARRGKNTGDRERSLRELEACEPSAPRVPKLLRGDETPENLAWSLAREWPSTGVVSSEAGIVLGAHGMGKDSIMRNLTLLNTLWDGGTHTVGRRTSESFTVKGARLTMALQVQEATLRTFLHNSVGLARGTGFLARFLVAWPESTQGSRFFTDPPQHWRNLSAFDRRISAILEQPIPIDEQRALTPPKFTFAADAKAAWVNFHDWIEVELCTGGELRDVRDVASKAADNASRLAALFHIFEHGCGAAVTLDAFERASRVVAWHLNESRRFLGEIALPIHIVSAAMLDRWLIDLCCRENVEIVPRKEAQRCGPGMLREGAALDKALQVLVEAGRVRLGHDGRRTDIYLNPALIRGGEL